MRRIAWNPSMETGDPLVDEQHRGLVRLFNELLAAEERGDSGVFRTRSNGYPSIPWCTSPPRSA